MGENEPECGKLCSLVLQKQEISLKQLGTDSRLCRVSMFAQAKFRARMTTLSPRPLTAGNVRKFVTSGALERPAPLFLGYLIQRRHKRLRRCFRLHLAVQHSTERSALSVLVMDLVLVGT